MSKTALILRTDATYEVVSGDIDLAFLQQQVGGWIEAVDINDGVIFVNEEGKLRGMQPNALASALWWTRSTQRSDHLAGTAVVMGPVDANGDTTDVTDKVIAAVLDLLGVRS